MKKHHFLSFMLLFAMALLLAGCEKPESVSKEEDPVETSVTEEKEPSTEIVTETEETEEEEMIEEEEASQTAEDASIIENKKFEGSQTLKRYMAD